MESTSRSEQPSLSPVEIALQEERRQADAVAEVATQSERIAGGTMSYSGKGSWTNQACGLGLDGPVSADQIDRFVDFYVSKGIEPKIEVCAFVDESLLQGLAAKGFEVREFENVLAVQMLPDGPLSNSVPHNPPQGLEFVPVDPTDSVLVRTYIEVSTSGFRNGRVPLSPEEFAVTKRVVEQPRCRHFLARIRGKVAGAGGVELGKGVSTLFGTTVLPDFRRKGIQAALILLRMERSREHGNLLCTIHSKPGVATERNAERLGFQMAYSKIIMAMRGDGLLPSP